MSLQKKIIELLSQIETQLLAFGGRMMYRRHYNNLYNQLRKKYPEMNHFDSAAEKKWREHWLRLSKTPDRKSFRLFLFYIGPDINIVPEDISASIIQPLLNPIETRPYYQDKNAFEKILPSAFLPKALFRMINGAYFTADYEPLGELSDIDLNELTKGVDVLFIKPATDSSSGHGVLKFSRNEKDTLICKDANQLFNVNFLNEYSKSNSNFIVQEALSQSEYIAQFNPSSINTLRVATYKSVVDNRTHVCAIILRIGKQGASVDNAHAGGLFIGVGLDGTIGKYACDQYGNKYDTFNGIDFKNENYRIPDFEKVISFAEKVGDSILHHRLVAQDICLQADGEPCLVEFNIRAFAPWLFQFTSGTAFGKYTDEIIDYCAKHKDEVRKVFVEPF
ncbi:sugar-transfer associated ATP-grasp domain-containing protein [Parabacteroides sp. ZJ-118]|uniref:sugar-transfer associated ATP-grasp domain-containing protein n=1 Tax=Parabacteroides sp. ZJ-118 TaxID=2709398 RepID=UPI0013E9F559|nr:sugar-transfer associated ATP-grasp domain-containing protein [Parabacteroides sp. ZJ-118]